MRKLSDGSYVFTIITKGPAYYWGENPELDSIGATLHLSNTKEVLEKEQFNWLRDHNIEYKTITHGPDYIIVEIVSKEDQTMFDLTWC